MQISVPWSVFKLKDLPITYAEANGNFYLFSGQTVELEFTCVIDQLSEDGIEFAANFQTEAQSLT